MPQDQHDPATQSSGTSGTAKSAAKAETENAAPKTAKAASSRTPRRRHTSSSRGRQTKEQKDQQKDQQGQIEGQKDTTEQPAVIAAEAPAPVEQPVVQESPATEIAAQVAAATPATTEPAPRATTRGRRGGANRRRSGKAEKAEQPDVQLVPVVSAPEPDASESATPADGQPEIAPAAELLPLDAAILAHLDALSAAAAQSAGQEPAHEEAQATQAAAEEQPPTAMTPVEEEPRSRYRFGKPRSPIAPAQATARSERLSGWRATPPALLTPLPAEASESAAARNEIAAAVAEPAEHAATNETEVAVLPAETPTEAFEAPEASAVEAAANETEPATAEAATSETGETADEQSEREGPAHRRRRGRGRGRNGRAQEAETGEAEADEQEPEPEQERPGRAETPSSRHPAPYGPPNGAVTYAREYENNGYMTGMEGYDEPGYTPYTPAPRTRSTQSTQSTRPSAPASRASRHQEHEESPWEMATAQQHVQEPESPFGAPEPSFARGFGPQSSGVAAPLHEAPPRVRRGERAGEAPPMSANQLGSVLTNAIAQQTDRLLNELRRQAYPPSMTVALPAFPSTERVGVFVDVANLLYSARSQRMSIDFGRLLDFLRANRRLIRAHAYAPTNPDPHAEQTFLSAVKGVGYRITTKNYKTFASGARKADMDLDLCMDIVRMVDAGALDTVVLVSGDSDFLPLLEYCSDHGVRVEVAAFDDAAAMILRQSCDLFINLSQVDEIRM